MENMSKVRNFLFLPLQTLDHSIENWPTELIVRHQLLFGEYGSELDEFACAWETLVKLMTFGQYKALFDWELLEIDYSLPQLDLNCSNSLPPPLLDWMQMDWLASWTF